MATTEYMRDYYLKNKEKLKEASRKRYYADPKKSKARHKQWRKDNPEKFKEIQLRYKNKNIDKFRIQKAAIEHSRRARLRGAKGSYTADEFIKLCEAFGNVCIRCFKDGKLTADHIQPISRGGNNTIENIQPLCQPCNNEKFTQSWDYRFWFMVA